jgi:hypothetical protein
MVTLFFSYSHRDETLRDEMEIHLTMLKRQGAIATWHDRRIGAGKEFGKEISHYLEKAEIILLLVSPDFLASDYCYDVEMARALERHKSGEARVIPIILRPCDWHNAPFGKLLAVPKDGKPVTKYPNQDDAFLEIAGAIRGAANELQSSGRAETQASLPQATAGRTVSGVRSSNLRLRKTFSDQDKDSFLEETFAFIANFFEGSLTELERRTQGISTKFRRIDANHFTAAIYHNGAAKSQCKIWLAARDRFTGNINYSSDLSTRDNSYNESLTIEDDGYSLFLKPMMGGAFGGDRNMLLSQEGAAEHLWEMLIRLLQ